jgi:hypothetical protein
MNKVERHEIAFDGWQKAQFLTLGREVFEAALLSEDEKPEVTLMG